MAAEQLRSLWAQFKLLSQQIPTVVQHIEVLLFALKTDTNDDKEYSSSVRQHFTDAAILASMPSVGLVILTNLLAETGSAIRDRGYTDSRCLTGVAPAT